MSRLGLLCKFLVIMSALSWKIMRQGYLGKFIRVPCAIRVTGALHLMGDRNLFRLFSTDVKPETTRGPYPGKKFNAFPFPYHFELEICIEDVTNLGMGIGRAVLDNGDRWVIMVPTVLPGEIVKVRIYRNHDSYSEADLLSIIKASDDRIEPLCRYFQSCGGCQYQHMNITAQRKWKKNQVISLLQRIGRLNVRNDTSSVINDGLTVNDVVGSDHLFYYRAKMTPHYGVPNPSKPMKIGFQKKNSNIIVDVDHCPIASKAINKKYAEARQSLLDMIQNNNKTFKRGATMLFREADNNYVSVDPREMVTQTVNKIKFEFKAGEFFQNNPHVLSLMVDHVLRQASSSKDGLCRYLVDAYCGSGLFSLCAAHLFQSVYGVEVSQLAVDAAKRNAEINNIGNAHFVCGSSEAIFDQIVSLPGNETVVIIDPPRKGCDMVFLSQLFDFKPKRIIYVSCDPATQARDTKHILENGYSVEDITPFDLFPQTRHIENVITYKLDK